MKKLILIFVFISGFLFSQNNFNHYLNLLTFPELDCFESNVNIEKFNSKVQSIQKELDIELESSFNKTSAQISGNEENQNLMNSLGLYLSKNDRDILSNPNSSPDDIKRIKQMLALKIINGEIQLNEKTGKKLLNDGKTGAFIKLSELFFKGINGELEKIRGRIFSASVSADSFYYVSLFPLSLEQAKYGTGENLSSALELEYKTWKKNYIQAKKNYCEVFSGRYSAACKDYYNYLLSNKDLIEKTEKTILEKANMKSYNLLMLRYLNEYCGYLSDLYKFNILNENEKE